MGEIGCTLQGRSVHRWRGKGGHRLWWGWGCELYVTSHSSLLIYGEGRKRRSQSKRRVMCHQSQESVPTWRMVGLVLLCIWIGISTSGPQASFKTALTRWMSSCGGFEQIGIVLAYLTWQNFTTSSLSCVTSYTGSTDRRSLGWKRIVS